MTVSITPSRFTPDDVLDLEDEGLFELVDGKLVEKKLGALAAETAGVIAGRLFIYLQHNHAGKFYNEQTYRCFPHDPGLIRRPDISFVAEDRLSGVPDEGHTPIAPDLAIEVVSPTDRIYDLDRKLKDYRSAGAKCVWVVNPESRILRVYGPDSSLIELAETDTITGGNVLPGFSIPVKDLLPPIKSS